MSNVKAKCPYCGSEYAVEDRHVGVVVKCTKCLKPFQVSPIFASSPKRFSRKLVKWGLIIVFVVSLVAIVSRSLSNPKRMPKAQSEEFFLTQPDVRHFRHCCEIMQKGDIEVSIKTMRDIPPDASSSFRKYMNALADELSGMASLMNQLESRFVQTKFAMIWDDERILAGVHPNYSMVHIIDDSNRMVDELIADLKNRKENNDMNSRRVLRQLGSDGEVTAKLYDELIRVCYMYKGVVKDAKTIYDLYQDNKACWYEECGDVIVTDRKFISKINTAIMTLRKSVAALVVHCQSRERAGMNQAKRAVDQLERLVR